jgi:hypothetical protein
MEKGGNTMPKKTFDVPGTAGKMIIEHDSEKNLVSVTDEKGRTAKKVKMGALKIKIGDIEAAIVDAPDGTTFVTKHNPTCRWVLKNGTWYYVCT